MRKKVQYAHVTEMLSPGMAEEKAGSTRRSPKEKPGLRGEEGGVVER